MGSEMHPEIRKQHDSLKDEGSIATVQQAIGNGKALVERLRELAKIDVRDGYDGSADELRNFIGELESDVANLEREEREETNKSSRALALYALAGTIGKVEKTLGQPQPLPEPKKISRPPNATLQ